MSKTFEARRRQRSFTRNVLEGLKQAENLLQSIGKIGLLMITFGRGGIEICKWKKNKKGWLLTQS